MPRFLPPCDDLTGIGILDPEIGTITMTMGPISLQDVGVTGLEVHEQVRLPGGEPRGLNQHAEGEP